ncbi:hypothetical protein JCM10003_916 [Bacteroides pyogenes JCM 10003]|nr:hypothetical protein JCM10003_916 [Bacteroides pyogenes JCM 10003]
MPADGNGEKQRLYPARIEPLFAVNAGFVSIIQSLRFFSSALHCVAETEVFRSGPACIHLKSALHFAKGIQVLC